ncbi:tripartite tricarboxylate transporter TctB family protein [Mycolicibacterium sp. BiH015]|uniref:tripartite tricarboxylate transporter TctB family protein n=1 Tax=Mycolicibacterium sp. BiH015 TaxID=3018808 RepID=UPI0022E2B172|nr:tripartite tricarboxylate transporter TctB family protein [Mycolicibacterium sp. BiH015]MDA2892557.1 tripartite tricarboxylate transporter TctB family protein [Mycolicibacterium sp. BiH015]
MTSREHETPPAASPPGSLMHRAFVPLGQLALAAVGLYVAVESTSLGLWTTLGPGPGLLPLILGAALFVLTAIWAVQAVVERRRAAADADSAPAEPLDRIYVVGVVGGLIVLAIAMPFVGFQISMAVFLFLELLILGRQRWWIAAAVAAAGSFGVFLLFDRVLAVQLPLSSLPFLSGVGL